MATVTREVWECDQCKWQWIPRTAEIPKQCPSRKCRSRAWNSGLYGVEMPKFSMPKQFKPSKALAAIAAATKAGIIKHAENCTCYTCKPPK